MTTRPNNNSITPVAAASYQALINAADTGTACATLTGNNRSAASGMAILVTGLPANNIQAFDLPNLSVNNNGIGATLTDAVNTATPCPLPVIPSI